ncbi:hypothetical protein FHP25_35095 [Vineibacter terrae]|uniref:Lipoprotein n=1 Tax=Vineibacter terrae TaxID=2586908 RepID=A0A5C8PA99_9HYPH|nr:hypothetical protein [Vineibacter terrae]TXL70355.1 hypothetical protein FHP25_35095 [Vineibacter terrae]
MRRVIAALAIGLAIGAVTGCGPQTTVITSEGAESPYSYQEYLAAADGRDFLVEVRGMPFPGMTQDAFNQALMGVLQAARPARPAATFTTRPGGPTMVPAYRLVLVFNPAVNLAHETQCRALDSIRPGQPTAGQVRVSVAFCRKDDLMSKAVAHNGATGVDDPVFRQMFTELFPVMFPPRNPFIESPTPNFE